MHISFLFHPTLFFPLLLNLEGVSTSSSSFSASSHGKNEYLFQRQEQREAASGQKQPSLPPSLLCLSPSSQGSVLSGWEWMKVILWLTESQTRCCCSSSAVQTVTRCSAFACFSCVYSCVDQQHQQSPAANWYCGFHACVQARGMCIRLWVLDVIREWLRLIIVLSMQIRKRHLHYWASKCNPHQGAGNRSKRLL